MTEPSDKPTIEDLQADAEDGDHDAFMAYSVRSLPALYRYMRYRCSLNDIAQQYADDFCHDAVVKAAQHIREKVASGDEIKISLQWLKTIAYRLMLDHLKRDGRWVSENDFDAYSVGAEDDADSLEEVAKFFEWLPPGEQEVIEQLIVKKLTLPEAAEVMGISADAAKRRYHRAVAHLRDFVVQHGNVPASVK